MTTATKPKIAKVNTGNQVAPLSSDLKEKERIFQLVIDKIAINSKLNTVNVALSPSRSDGVNVMATDVDGNKFMVTHMAWLRKDINVNDLVALMHANAMETLALNKKNAVTLGLKDDQYTDTLGNPVNPMLSNRDRFRNTRWSKGIETIDTDNHLDIEKLARKEFDQFGFFNYSIQLTTLGVNWVQQVVKPDVSKFLTFSENTRIEKEPSEKVNIIMVCTECNEEFANVKTHKHLDVEELAMIKGFNTFIKQA